jgi:hypothetical protein
LIESIFWYTENFGFRFVTKQTETNRKFMFLVSRNTTETDLVLVCYGSDRNFFVLFREHHNHYTIHIAEPGSTEMVCSCGGIGDPFAIILNRVK